MSHPSPSLHSPLEDCCPWHYPPHRGQWAFWSTNDDVFPTWRRGKEPACQCRRRRRSGFCWSRRSPGGGRGNSLQYSCLENPMDRGIWWATDHGITESYTTEHLRTHDDDLTFLKSNGSCKLLAKSFLSLSWSAHLCCSPLSRPSEACLHVLFSRYNKMTSTPTPMLCFYSQALASTISFFCLKCPLQTSPSGEPLLILQDPGKNTLTLLPLSSQGPSPLCSPNTLPTHLSAWSHHVTMAVFMLPFQYRSELHQGRFHSCEHSFNRCLLSVSMWQALF